MKPIRANGIALCLAALLLSACSGGGSGGIVRTTASPPPPPPPPPPPSGEPCPMPIAGDCVVEGRYTPTFDEYGMTGGRQSDHRLFVHGGSAGGGWVNLGPGEYRFSGGTEIAGTTLVVWGSLVSDVRILHDYTGLGFVGQSELWLLGSVQGSVRNEERLNLRCWSGLHDCSSIPQQRIDGDYTQLQEGVLETVLGRHLQVGGAAVLDGRLLLVGGDVRYVLPTAPASVLVLHADGGIDGTFDSWSTSSLFLEGALRYIANDVFFDAVRISLQGAAAANGIRRPLSLASAANLDLALAGADAFALAPQASLDDAQRRFLASASSLLWLQDAAQAERSFDSLAGHAHAAVRGVLHRQGEQVSAQLAARLARQRFATGPVPWTGEAQWRSGGHGFDGLSSGIDRWLSPRLLVGGGITRGRASLRFDRLGGGGWGESPGANLYAHYRGDGWHTTGTLGAGRASLQLQRSIELGGPDRHVVHARRSFDHAFVHGELGRDVPLGEGRLVPFLALDYGVAHGDAFVERGDTGLELAAGASRQARFSGAMGARYARDWSLGRHRLRLELDARHRRELVDGDPLRAAFRGVPDVWFELPDARDRASGELRVGLDGSGGTRTRWSMDYRRGFGGGHRDEGWTLGLWRAF